MSDKATIGEINQPPRSWKSYLKNLGPGLTWMAAGAGGAGELLLPPRIGSLYGYTFLWAIVAAVILKWFMTREVGRFATITGASLMQGFRTLPGPRNWAIWLIVIPQLAVAVASIGGLASSAATAVILFAPGSVTLWMAVIITLTTTFLLLGAYSTLERAATVLAILLALIAIVAAITVFPAPADLLAGLQPRLPAETDYTEVLPWLSFVLAGAAGMIWYSYWLPASQYGTQPPEEREQVPEASAYADEQRQKIRGWLREMNIDLTFGVVGGFLIVCAFLILGAELLQPEGVVPEKDEVARVLGRLFGDIWGRVGFWIMVVGVLIGFTATVLTNQDGWARLLSDGSNIILRALGVKGKWAAQPTLRKGFLILLLGAGPVLLYLLIGEPVALVQLAGIIEAIHIPIILFLTLYLNTHRIPADLRPSLVSKIGAVLAGVFFIGFAVLFILQKTGILGG